MCPISLLFFLVIIEYNLEHELQTFSHHCRRDELFILSHILCAVVPVTVNVGALQMLNRVTLFSG